MLKLAHLRREFSLEGVTGEPFFVRAAETFGSNVQGVRQLTSSIIK